MLLLDIPVGERWWVWTHSF